MAIYSETFGFIITINTGQGLDSATNFRLRIKPPTGSTVDKLLTDSAILSPKSAGKVVYDVVEGDFPVGGKYYIQLFDETAGRRLASAILTLDVKQSLTI